MTMLDYPDIEVKLEAAHASDLDVLNAAKVSVRKHSSNMEEHEEGLIRYLMKNRHGSPFEHGYMRFRVKVPIFVVREHHRHRIGHSYNEVSGRYVELAPEFYMPHPDRIMLQTGKPGAYKMIEADDWVKDEFLADQVTVSELCWGIYQKRINQGMEKGLARICLPVSIFTEYVWSCNPRSLMHFLSLRQSPNALAEIQQVASLCDEYFEMLMPSTRTAFIENGRVCP